MTFKSILLEATEYVDGASLAKAILRGQIAGISKKFFNGEEPDTEALDKFLKVVKTNFDKSLQNKAIVLLLNKTKTINNLKYVDNQIIDATKSYFDNINKEEAKKPEIKELFDKFEEVNLTDPFNQDFENKINELFEDSMEMKSNDEYEVIYPTDEDGWEIVSPKTFGAAKYLSSFKGVGKAFWCTAAHAYQFRNYTENNNKLYIIRNLKKKIFYQMDWGYQNDWLEPSFQNFYNRSVTVKEVLDTIPTKVLNAIKNEDNAPIGNFIKKAENYFDTKNFIDKDWSYEKLSPQQFKVICSEYNVDFYFFNAETEYAKDFLKKDSNNNKFFLVKNNKFFLVKNNKFNKMFLFCFPTKDYNDDSEKIFLYELYKDENGYKRSVELRKNDILKNKIFKNIKDKFFSKKELEKPDYTNYSVKNAKIYLIRNTAAFTKVLPDDIYNMLFKYKKYKKDYYNNDSYYESHQRIISNLFEHETKFPILYIEKNTPQEDCLIIFLRNFNEIKNVSINYRSINFLSKTKTYYYLQDNNLLNFMKKNFFSYYKMITADFTDKKYYERERKERKYDTFFVPLIYKNKAFYYFDSENKIIEFYRRYKNKYKFEIIDGNNGKKLLIFNSLMVVENNTIKRVYLYNLSEEEKEAVEDAFNYNKKAYFFDRTFAIDIKKIDEKKAEKDYKELKDYTKETLKNLKANIKDEE